MTLVADTDDVSSPCVKRCQTDVETNICSGCHRTASEIANWTKMSKERRRRVIARIAAFRASSSDDNAG